MAAKVSYNSHDYVPVDIVPVIASFDANGHIAPLYVRIQGQSYKIGNYHVKCNYANSVSFNCNVIDGDVLKPVMLTYFQDENIWTIPKRQP